MKKLLALVLALIMVLGLGVTAFADPVKVIVLDKEKDEDEDLEDIVLLPDGELTDANTNESTYIVFEGGDYYIPIVKTGLKNITVSATGNVTAEIVKFDPEKQVYPGANIIYFVVDGSETDNRNDRTDTKYPGVAMSNLAINAILDEKLTATEKGAYNEALAVINPVDGYDYADFMAEALNDALKTSRFSATAFELVEGKWVKLNKDLLKITVADNYSAAYKEGTVKVTATRDKKAVVANLTIISDVTIFEYEEVKWAGDNAALVINDDGYSDYFTAKAGYDFDDDGKYNEELLRHYPNATVVSTTAFRAIEGEELEVGSEEKVGTDHAILVTIDEVAKGQKGVNFAYDTFTYYDEDGEEVENAAGVVTKNFADLKGEVEYFEFGFLGDQVIASDFEIEVKLPWDAFKLRELFGKKVEEEDIITYYVLKDGVKIDEFTIDYKDDAIDEDIELEILGKAGDKLGYYTITLDAPAAEEKGEENPNTGAESVVGVVAAMAVISLATAAAVSLKK